MTTKTNTAPLPASAMRALAAAGAAGNVPAAQAFAAQLTAHGTFAHLDAPQARAGFAAHVAAHTATGPDRNTAAGNAAFILAAAGRGPAAK